MRRSRTLLLDLLALAALVLALLAGSRGAVGAPDLDQLVELEGVATNVVESGDLLRFQVGVPTRSIALRAATSAGWVALRAAVREGRSLTLWVAPGSASGSLTAAPDAWQLAAGEQVLVPYQDVVRWAEREARLGRVLCVVLALGAGLLLAAHRLPASRRAVNTGLGRRRRVRTTVGVAGILGLLGGSLMVHGWSLRVGTPDLEQRTGTILERELRSSDGRLNSLRLRLEGAEATFVLFRKGTPRFEELVERLEGGVLVELVTDSDAALEARGPLARLFLKPRVHGVSLGGEELLAQSRTRQALRDSTTPILLGGVALIVIALRAVRGVLRERIGSSI